MTHLLASIAILLSLYGAFKWVFKRGFDLGVKTEAASRLAHDERMAAIRCGVAFKSNFEASPHAPMFFGEEG